jgi:hypothetical protein
MGSEGHLGVDLLSTHKTAMFSVIEDLAIALTMSSCHRDWSIANSNSHITIFECNVVIGSPLLK